MSEQGSTYNSNLGNIYLAADDKRIVFLFVFLGGNKTGLSVSEQLIDQYGRF